MVTVACYIAFVAIAFAMLLSGLRLLRGPDAADRILAFDTLYINTVALFIVLGIYDGPIYFEAALLIALTGFVATVALARYLARGDVME